MPELPLDMTPGGNVIRLPTMSDAPISTGRTADLPSSGGFDKRRFAALALAGLSDAFAGIGGKQGNALSTILTFEKLAAGQRAEERKAEVEERKLQLETFKAISEMNGQRFREFTGTLESLGKFRMNAPNATEAELAETASKATEFGVPLAAANAILRRVDVAKMAGELAPFLTDPAIAARTAVTADAMARSGQQEKIGPMFQTNAAPFLSRELFARVPEIVSRLRALPGFDELPAAEKFQTLTQYVGALPATGEGLAAMLRGEYNATEALRASYPQLLNAVVPVDMRPDIAASAAEAGAKTEATELAKTTPAVTAGKAKQAKSVSEATELGKLTPAVISRQADRAGAIARAQEAARADFAMPPLAQGALNELAQKKIDPRKATREQIAAATTASEQRATKVKTDQAEAVKRAEMRVEIGLADQKPATPEEVDRLRDDFTQGAKPFVVIRDAYSRVKASMQSPSAAGDLAMIFNYMKMLDPGSVIRESEFAQAAAAGSYGERIEGFVRRALSGQRLADAVRDDFADRAQRLFREQLATHEELEGQFKGLAKKRKIDEGRVVPDLVGRFRTEGKGGGGDGKEADTPDARARRKFLPKGAGKK